MIENEECECPVCQYLSELPIPRNREERRLQEKETRATVKKLYNFHMARMTMEAVAAELMEMQDYEDGCEMKPI